MAAPDRLPLRLQATNLARWVREYLVSWGLLSVIYSITVTVVLQPLLENAFKRELPLLPLWVLTCSLLLVPGLLEALPLPPLGRLVRERGFSEGLFAPLGGALGRLYLRHELRRGTTWFAVLATVLAAQLVPARLHALWVLAALLPVQRALYSIHRWRPLALASGPETGAQSMIGALIGAQVIELGVAWLALGATGTFASREAWLAYGAAAFSGVVAASAMAMEGDSGRPWMVNFISMAAGILCGYLALASPWFILLALYVAHVTRNSVGQRLKSVEHLDEDTLIP